MPFEIGEMIGTGGISFPKATWPCKGFSGLQGSQVPLVTAVNVLPLGLHKWALIPTQYNNYAELNNQAIQELDPLKIMFWALVNHKKPTAIDKQAKTLACDDTDSADDGFRRQ
ncbi:uncharacterized protein VP01_506g4 [Puccinia sorghi]|uniref:Uncharacterized protein n=1 Tax=Puccinia sorghi TaxID=27349 RepID=A0A0L6ULG1_9BASI|nr:uncharacterized protein VP01_506g4 [Puccinia sorghi]